jgi:DNA-binding Lrp family transcriptional regulator
MYGIVREKAMGRRRKNGADGDVPAGLRIRREIVSILYRNPRVSVKIPTSVELAKQFGVARCTVTDELRKLVDQGLLIGKRGVGTFTNPEALPLYSHIPGKRVAGILVRDARMFGENYTSWILSSSAGTAMLPDIAHPCNVSLNEQSPELMYKELSLLNLDGVVWVLPPERMAPQLTRMLDSGTPVVTLHQTFPGVPGIGLDFAQQGRDLAEILIRERRTRVLWCAFDQWVAESQSEAERAFAEQGLRQDPALVCRDPKNFDQRLEELLADGPPFDAIYVHGESLFMVLDILRAHGVDPYTDCLLIANYGLVRKLPDFKGIVRHAPLEDMGREAADMLKEQFDGVFDMERPHRNRRFTLEHRM